MPLDSVLIATDTNTVLSGTGQTIQGVIINAGNDILVTAQTDGTQNGLWVAAAGPWTRHPDYDTGAEFVQGMSFLVRGGDYANTRWHFLNQITPVIGSSVLNFDMWARDEVLRAGGGLQIDETANTVGLTETGVGAANFGTDPFFRTQLDGRLSDASYSYHTMSFIRGFVPVYRPASPSTVDFYGGVAWLEDRQEVLSGITSSVGGALSASTWYYFFAIAGSEPNQASINYSTVAPAAPYEDGWYGRAQSNGTGRYIAALKTNASSVFYNFGVEGDGNNPLVTYLETTNAAPFRVLAGGTAATTGVNISCAAVVPPTARYAHLMVDNTATAGNVRLTGAGGRSASCTSLSRARSSRCGCRWTALSSFNTPTTSRPREAASTLTLSATERGASEMPQRYAICNRLDESAPQDGKEVSFRAYDPDTMSDLKPYEVLVEEAPAEDEVWDANAGTLRARSATEELSAAKASKESELRDAANAWYRDNIRGFEGAVVIHKIDRGAALTAEETAIRDAMLSNYTKLRNLVSQTRAATTVEGVEAVQW